MLKNPVDPSDQICGTGRRDETAPIGSCEVQLRRYGTARHWRAPSGSHPTTALERYLGAPPDAARYRAHHPREYDAGYRAATRTSCTRWSIRPRRDRQADLPGGLAVMGQQDDPGPAGGPHRRRVRRNSPGQLSAFLVGRGDWGSGPHARNYTRVIYRIKH